jgi:hypothetical protein
MYWQVAGINVVQYSQLPVRIDSPTSASEKKLKVEQSRSRVAGGLFHSQCTSFIVQRPWPSHIMPAVALRLDIISSDPLAISAPATVRNVQSQ